MVDLFNTILKMSINASIVILAVILARVLLYKAPKRFSYLLWSVVGFGLYCPISFQTVFRIFELGEPSAPKLPNIGGDIIISDSQSIRPTVSVDALLHTDGQILSNEFAERLDRIEIFNIVVMAGLSACPLYCFMPFFLL